MRYRCHGVPLRFGGLPVLLLLGCGPDVPAADQPMLTTRAERTRYEQTTGYGEVVQFMERAAALSDRVHFTTFGDTVEGRPLPLVVVGDPTDARPAFGHLTPTAPVCGYRPTSTAARCAARKRC